MNTSTTWWFIGFVLAAPILVLYSMSLGVNSTANSIVLTTCAVCFFAGLFMGIEGRT